MRYIFFGSFVVSSLSSIAQKEVQPLIAKDTFADGGVLRGGVNVSNSTRDISLSIAGDGLYDLSAFNGNSFSEAHAEFKRKGLAGFEAGIFQFQSRSLDNMDTSFFGDWRGVFHLENAKELPFNFAIQGKSIADAKVFFINGEERFESGGLQLQGDSLFIQTSPFDNELAFCITNDTLKGVLRRRDLTGRALKVSATRGDYRFSDIGLETDIDISGTYAVSFKNEKGADEQAVGLFAQHGRRLKATFLRITGDSRYLDGIVQGRHFRLSSFIGSSPVLYEGEIVTDSTLKGDVFFSRGKQGFEAIRDEDASLPDAYQITLLKKGYSTLDFKFPDVDGKMVSIKDEKYRNKVVIVTIGGTWCPNCIDEAAFLAPWYKANRTRGIEVISIHFERQTDSAYIKKVLTRFRQRFDIEYDELVGGIADKQKVAESMPALNAFLSFPTTIFIDKNGKVSKIHTGFSGPATGIHYARFVQEFSDLVDKLVNERQ
ncbi:MAG: peroxiredoxin family protein [Chitinophagaceae bacterium]